MRHGGDGSNLLVRAADGTPAGYSRFDDGQAEFVVAPAARAHGLGTALVTALEQLAGHRALSVWAHGDLPGARALAESRGYSRERVLLQMRRDLAGVDPDPPPPPPDGVQVRPFVVGRDEAAWLRVNAAAFATHPEQGSWSAEDVALREAEPWFDPAGFLLAWRGDPDAGGELLGFHWTKVHPAVGDDPAIGEIYVLGVDPGGHRRGLGRALSVAGLQHLAAAGLTQAMLYVDESNEAAVALYRGLGFEVYATDVSYQR
jgi:mycothiol synthase